MGVTIAHGSFPHQATAFMTSGPVAAAGADRCGSAEVDAFLAPWSALRATAAMPDVPMRVVARGPCMGWPGTRGADDDVQSDVVAHDSDDEDADTVSASVESAPDGGAAGPDDDRGRQTGAAPVRADATPSDQYLYSMAAMRAASVATSASARMA
jgi:hypothetical protein